MAKQSVNKKKNRENFSGTFNDSKSQKPKGKTKGHIGRKWRF